MNPLLQILDRSNFSPTTKTSYARHIQKWLEFAGDDPNGWTKIRAQEFYDSLIARGLKVNSANVYIASLRYVSKWYASTHNRPDLDFSLVQTREEFSEKTQRALSQDETEALLATCGGSHPTPIERRDRTLIVTGLETGMRRMSLAAMSFEGLGEQNGYPVAKVPIKGAGGRAVHTIPLSDTALLAINDWRGWLHEAGVKRGALFVRLRPRIGERGRTTYIPEGPGISTTMIHTIITERAKAAKIDHVHPHLLRHTFITWRTLQGLNAAQIAAITGHTVPGLGALGGYIDMKAIAEAGRSSTPPWLAALVKKFVG